MTYQEAVDYFYGFADYERLPGHLSGTARFDLRRVEQLLHRLGDPHLERRTVHIAGTKGKGSVAAMTASVLEAAGYPTGLLTSPHLCYFRERVRFRGQAVPEADLAGVVERLRPEVEAYHRDPCYGWLTTFELVTVAAFVYFQKIGATAQVLEVGLGGRLDATNVVPKPDLCVITPVSYDHTEVLGDTLAAIAAEKAGIVKAGVPLVMAPQEEEARKAIAQRCQELDAPLVDVSGQLQWSCISRSLEGQRFLVRGSQPDLELWTPLLGAFQLENAATVVASAAVLEKRGGFLGREAVREALLEGMAAVRWPGRFQVLSREPLLLVDGAHNGASAGRLREALSAEAPHRRCLLLVGISADKDLDAIARALAPAATMVIATRSSHPRAADPEDVARAFAGYGVSVQVSSGVTAGLEAAYALAEPQDLICATGSLFVVGEVLQDRGLADLALEAFHPEGRTHPVSVGVVS